LKTGILIGGGTVKIAVVYQGKAAGYREPSIAGKIAVVDGGCGGTVWRGLSFDNMENTPVP